MDSQRFELVVDSGRLKLILFLRDKRWKWILEIRADEV